MDVRPQHRRTAGLLGPDELGGGTIDELVTPDATSGDFNYDWFTSLGLIAGDPPQVVVTLHPAPNQAYFTGTQTVPLTEATDCPS